MPLHRVRAGMVNPFIPIRKYETEQWPVACVWHDDEGRTLWDMDAFPKRPEAVLQPMRDVTRPGETRRFGCDSCGPPPLAKFQIYCHCGACML